jgi:hypothetical protein
MLLNKILKDPQDELIECTYFTNKDQDLIIEFITRDEGMHKIYVYINRKLVNESPFYIYVNGDISNINHTNNNSNNNSLIQHQQQQLSNSLSYARSSSWTSNYFSKSQSTNMSSSTDLRTSNSDNSLISDSTTVNTTNFCQKSFIFNRIMCSKVRKPFHFVLNNKNVQGLSIYGKAKLRKLVFFIQLNYKC